MKTVLVVDDEPLVVTLVARALTEAGFHVIEAQDAEEALEISRDPSVEIHLLLTDLIMPTMNGRQLRDKIAEIRPHLAVTYMSGYTDSSARELMGSDAAHLLLKPFAASSLLTAVADGVERTRANAAAQSPEGAVV